MDAMNESSRQKDEKKTGQLYKEQTIRCNHIIDGKHSPSSVIRIEGYSIIVCELCYQSTAYEALRGFMFEIIGRR